MRFHPADSLHWPFEEQLCLVDLLERNFCYYQLFHKVKPWSKKTIDIQRLNSNPNQFYRETFIFCDEKETNRRNDIFQQLTQMIAALAQRHQAGYLQVWLDHPESIPSCFNNSTYYADIAIPNYYDPEYHVNNKSANHPGSLAHRYWAEQLIPILKKHPKLRQ